MAHQNLFFVAMPIMKAIALALLVFFTIGTFTRFSPTSISKKLKFGMPNTI